MSKTNRLILGLVAILAAVSCQDVTSPINSLTLSSKLVEFEYSPEKSAVVEVSSSAEWSAESVGEPAEWLSFRKDGDNLVLSAEPNPSVHDRVAEVSVCTNDRKVSLTVIQIGFPADITFTPDIIEAPKEGGVYKVKVESNIDWTIDASEKWMEFSTDSGKAGVSELTVTVPANLEFVPRTSEIGFYLDMKRYALIPASQEKFKVEISLETDTVEADLVAGSKVVRFSSNYSWKASSSDKWLTVSPTSGLPGEDIELTLTYPDAKGVERSSTVTVSGGSGEEKVEEHVYVHQGKADIDEIEIELYFSDGTTINQPFTTNLTTSAASAKNLGVKDYVIKNTEYHVELYGSYIASLLNTKAGLMFYPTISGAHDKALREVGFAFLHLPAIPEYKLTSLKTETLSSATSTQAFPVYITPTYGNSDEEALAAAIATGDVGRKKTTEFVFANSVAGVGYYIYMPSKGTGTAVAASYQFGTITATYAK